MAKPPTPKPANETPARTGIPPETDRDDDLPPRDDAAPPDEGDDTEAPPARPAVRAKEQAPACPPGFAVFLNASSDSVKFSLRDEGNRGHAVTCKSGKHCLVPVEYADLIPKRAPQLREIDRRARERPDDSDD